MHNLTRRLAAALAWLREGLAALRADLAADLSDLPRKLRHEWDWLRFRDAEPHETDTEYIASVAHLLPPAALAERPAAPAADAWCCQGCAAAAAMIGDMHPEPDLDAGEDDMAPPCANCGSRIRYSCCDGCPGRVEPTPDGPTAALDRLGAIWSDDFAAYASGELDASQVHCALCMCAPCRCPAFGTPEYMALVDFRHGRTRGTR